MTRPIVSIDFDGVVHSYTSPFDLTKLDPPVPGAFDAIRRFQRAGWGTSIFSSRSHIEGGIAAMTSWFLFHAEEENSRIGCGTAWVADVQFPVYKPMATISIDDRAFQFNGDWAEFDPRQLAKFRPWNKR